MSISNPRYAAGSVARVGRLERTTTITRRELRRRSTWGTWLAVGLTFLTVTAFVVVTVEFASLAGSPLPPAFESPYESPVWVLLILIVAASVGAGAIAEDLGNRSITLYLSRPIRLIDYLTAKAGAIGSWILLVAIGPGIAAIAIEAVIGGLPSGDLWAALAGFVATGVLAAIFFTGLALALSSMTRRGLYAGVGLFGIVLALSVGVSVVSGITGNSSVLYASPTANLQIVAEAAFGLSGPFVLNPIGSAAILAGSGVALAALAWWRLSRIEAVGE